MMQLLKKDLRVYRMVFLAAAALWTVGPALTWVAWLMRDPRTDKNPGEFIGGLGYAALFVTVVFAALLGGAAFAAERRDKTADFLGMMPVPRRKIILSKLILSVAVLSVLWAMALGTLVIAVKLLSKNDPSSLYSGNNDPNLYEIRCGMSLAITTFGLAWLQSTFLKDPVAPSILALLEMGAMMFFVGMYLSHHSMPDSQSFWMFSTMPIAVGLLSWIAGTFDYARRVEP